MSQHSDNQSSSSGGSLEPSAYDRDASIEMLEWIRELYPINRSLTGPGVRQTLEFLATLIPELRRHQIASGEPVFDWTVPDEWTLREAFIEDSQGRRLVDANTCNLHVMSYSEPVNEPAMNRQALDEHLYSLPSMPDAIPYLTSYYKRRWGFCLSEEQRSALGDGPFRVRIDADLEPGHLDYADVVLPGESDSEIFISTYICHPSMANNELSGPSVATALYRWLKTLPRRRYTYRFLFAPETLGALTYLSRHLEELKSRVKAGFILTCIGDDRAHTVVRSKYEDTASDSVASHVSRHWHREVEFVPFTRRQSDERQYGFPGVELPMVTVCRSLYGEYPEYHTSKDDLSVVTADGLAGGLSFVRHCIESLEADTRYEATTIGEPQLGRRGLYPTLGQKDTRKLVENTLNVLAYSDGRNSLIEIADRIGCPVTDLSTIAQRLQEAGLLRLSDQT